VTKARHGDGPAAAGFETAGERRLDLPHDGLWRRPVRRQAKPQPWIKAIGRNFPERSIGGTARRSPSGGRRGRRISVEFDGVFRTSVV